MLSDALAASASDLIVGQRDLPEREEREELTDFDIAHGEHFRVIDRTRRGPEAHPRDSERVVPQAGARR